MYFNNVNLCNIFVQNCYVCDFICVGNESKFFRYAVVFIFFFEGVIYADS